LQNKWLADHQESYNAGKFLLSGNANDRIRSENLFLLLMTIFSKSLFALMCSYLMTFSFFTARHNSNYLVIEINIISML
jgi:hypothetical protein